MRILVFEIALLGAAACGGLGLNAMLDVRNRPEFQALRQAELELSKPGADERAVLWGLGIFPDRYAEAKTVYRWTLWMCYTLLAATPVGILGAVLVRRGKGWLAGPLILLAAAGPLVCIARLSSYDGNILLFGLPAAAMALAGLLSFFVRAHPPAGGEEKATTSPT